MIKKGGPGRACSKHQRNKNGIHNFSRQTRRMGTDDICKVGMKMLIGSFWLTGSSCRPCSAKPVAVLSGCSTVFGYGVLCTERQRLCICRGANSRSSDHIRVADRTAATSRSISPSKPETLHVAHTVCLCVLCESHIYVYNVERLFL